MKTLTEQRSTNHISTEQLGEAALSFLLMNIYKDKFPNLPDLRYDTYDGEQLPVPSGFSLTNACLTYIKHGGDKSRAIEKFLDKHLRTYDDVETFLAESRESDVRLWSQFTCRLTNLQIHNLF